MVKFTQAQKDEFDNLYTRKTELSSFDAITEIRKHEAQYPVLYFYLFGAEDNCANQDNFALVWLDASQITVEIETYYLIVFAGMYVSLDPDNKVCFTEKYDFTIAYQKKFTQNEIDNMQNRPEFSGRISLDACKVTVEQDDKDNPLIIDNPPETDTDDSGDDSEDVDDSTTDDDSVASDGSDDDPKVDEAVADESELKG